jgi:putative oxidoreductase
MSIGTVALRGVVGPLFVGHGTQKLFGWFGGHGLEGTGGFFESLGLRPGKRHAAAAGASEALGGALLTVGAATPLAATMVSATMITAIRKVHAANGPWVTDNGFEYNAVLIGAMAVLVEHGPGSPSVDAKLFPSWKGPFWTLAMLAAATAGSFLVDAASQAPTEAEVTAAAA